MIKDRLVPLVLVYPNHIRTLLLVAHGTLTTPPRLTTLLMGFTPPLVSLQTGVSDD
jgi:hypothetical protein